MPQLRPLITNEVIMQNQFTHYMEIKVGDIPAGIAVNTPYVFNFGTVYTYNRVNNCLLVVQQPFEDTADAAFNTTTISVGEAAAPTGYINAAECNKNAGALVKAAWKTGAITFPKDYATPTILSFTINAMAAKTVSNLKKGSVIILFDIFKFAPPVDTDSV